MRGRACRLVVSCAQHQLVPHRLMTLRFPIPRPVLVRKRNFKATVTLLTLLVVYVVVKSSYVLTLINNCVGLLPQVAML
jgi:hypothetical protein